MEEKPFVGCVLVRCPNWVGDLVMAIPAFDCLRKGFEGAEFVGVAKGKLFKVLQGGPWFNHLIEAQEKSWAGLKRMVRRIREHRPDVAILFPNSFRSVTPIWWAGVKQIYGYQRDLRGAFLTGGPKPERNKGKVIPLPMQAYYLEICRSIGLQIPADPKPRLYVDEQVAEQGEKLLLKYGILDDETLVGLNPGANFGSSKCWPPEHFARVAELLEKKMGARILLFSGPGEEEIARAIVRESRAAIIDTTPDQVDLALLKPLIKRCDLLVTNDTGPRHYAVAFDVPVVVMMGPTDPRWTASNLENTVVLTSEADCSPCHKKTCPTDHRCMRNITPEAVYEAGQELLKENI